MDNIKLQALRQVINENLRVQRGGADPIPYINVVNSVEDAMSLQNHAIFARRGCGKTLLLHYTARNLPENIKAVYLNCEDFKKHSYPNVLIEILDALFGEIENQLTGWFGRKKASRELIKRMRSDLISLRKEPDHEDRDIRESSAEESSSDKGASIGVQGRGLSTNFAENLTGKQKKELETRYQRSKAKIEELDKLLPSLKRQVRDFFKASKTVKFVFLQVDDFYHLSRPDQPLVMDYLHRICKDVPLYFKIATLRHASILYADRDGQPLGAQERHDYQPINIDFDFSNLKRTQDQNRKILREFGKLAKIDNKEIDSLFKGEGFERLVLAGGGVPRDCLSLFLELLGHVQAPSGNGQIGKDEARILSRSNFERRIEELKQDADSSEQAVLIKGIYVLRKFCINRKTNMILLPEQVLQQNDNLRGLVYRLLDYRIIHNAGAALTHKTHEGTFHAFVIDVGCYAHMRKLQGRFVEIDLAQSDAKEKMRSGPILEESNFKSLWESAPHDPETAMLEEEKEKES